MRPCIQADAFRFCNHSSTRSPRRVRGFEFKTHWPRGDDPDGLIVSGDNQFSVGPDGSASAASRFAHIVGVESNSVVLVVRKCRIVGESGFLILFVEPVDNEIRNALLPYVERQSVVY